MPLAKPHVNTYTGKIPIYSRWHGLFTRLEGYEGNSVEYISFTNGVTRTLWLLENGVKVFPIECRIGEARDMQRAVGVADEDYITVEQLLPIYASGAGVLRNPGAHKARYVAAAV